MEGDLEHRAEDGGVREEAADGEKIKFQLDISPSSPQAKEYREKVEKELRDICNDVLVSNLFHHLRFHPPLVRPC